MLIDKKTQLAKGLIGAGILLTIMAICTPLFFRALYITASLDAVGHGSIIADISYPAKQTSSQVSVVAVSTGN